MLSFSGKTIVITGASSGIGLSTATLLDSLGANCVLIARRKDVMSEIASKLQNKSIVVPFDLSNIDEIKQMCTTISDSAGPVDGIVHAAGISITAGIRALSKDICLKSWNINFFSFLEIVKHFSRNSNFNPGLSIVAISSIAALQGNTGKTIYAATKAALDASIRCLAKELSSREIRLNSIAPGLIETAIYDNIKISTNNSPDLEAAVKRQYLGLGHPDDVAYAAAYLLSSVSRFVTGTTMHIDGGRYSS